MSDLQGETLTDLRVSYHVTLQHYYEQGLHCVVVYRHYGLALTHYLFSRSRQPQRGWRPWQSPKYSRQ